MGYYNVVSSLFGQVFSAGIYTYRKKSRQFERIWNTSLMAALKSMSMLLGDILQVCYYWICWENNQSVTFIHTGTQIGNYTILVTERLAIREAIMMATEKNSHRIIIESDSQLVGNAIRGKIDVRREVVNLVEDFNIRYRTRECNREANKMAKSAHQGLM